MRTNRRGLVSTLAAVALFASACGDDAGPTEAAAAAAEEERAVAFAGEMSLEPRSGIPGTGVTVEGAGLPGSAELDVLWVGAECDWVIKGGAREEYHGRECVPTEEAVATVTTDGDGNFSTTFEVPEGHGFAHDVLLVDAEDVVRNQALFSVEMEFSVTPTSGPVGTPITIEVRGMGWQSLEDTRTILYDNRYVGFMSAVTTDGVARAVIPATGAPGEHRIEINRGAYTFPYLNPAQSPRPDIPTFEAKFTVTEGDAVLPPPIEDQNPPVVRPSEVELPSGGPVIAADVISGPPGTPFAIQGAGFDPGRSLELRWFRIVGNRVAGQGWEERAISLGEITPDDDGTFAFATEIPGDVGGPHRIEAVAGDTTLAETSVAITPQADPLAAGTFSFGDDLGIHLTGVGWTETANIYTIVYDNAYVGYACGFNTQGDVQVDLKATGGPGWHFVDLYPAIYKGEELRGRDNFRIPQLTALDDHPGEDLPIFRFAFRIEE